MIIKYITRAYSIAWLVILCMHQTLAFIPTTSASRTSLFIRSRSGCPHNGKYEGKLASWTSSTGGRISFPLSRTLSTQLYSIFGLGPAELVVIAMAALFVIGPTTLSKWSREAGSLAGNASNELKELQRVVPEEFSKGMEEGEMNARSRNAKAIDDVVRVENE